MKISDFAGNNSNEGRQQARFWVNFLVPNQQGEFVTQSFLSGTPCQDWNSVIKIANRFPLLAAAMKLKNLSAKDELPAGETLRFKLSAHLGMELRAVGNAEATLNDSNSDLEVELL